MIKISKVLSPEISQINIKTTHKKDLIEEVVSRAMTHKHVIHQDAFKEAIWKREQEMSTGIGKGVGLPHAKTNTVSDIVMGFYSTLTAIPFDSVDEEPVDILFLLATPETMLTEHLKLLSKISRLVSKEIFRYKLRHAKNLSTIVEVIKEEESK